MATLTKVKFDDPSELDELVLTPEEWATISTARIREKMSRNMTTTFASLNAAVILIISLAMWHNPTIITEHVIMALIAGTVTQAGIIFSAMSKNLFPPPKQ